MDTHTTYTVPGVAYCTCCAPRQLLIPRDDVGMMGHWAVCLATGMWYAGGGDGRFAPSAGPQVGAIVPSPAQGMTATGAAAWAGGDALPAIVPGVRIDLSKETYA